MSVGQNDYAVTLFQDAPQKWVWRVLCADGREAERGHAPRADVAREQAEFFRRAIARLSER